MGDVSGLLMVVLVVMVFVGLWLWGKFIVVGDCEGCVLGLSVIVFKVFVFVVCLWVIFFFEFFVCYYLFYFCFLFLIWICLCYGFLGVILVMFVIMMGSLIGLYYIGSMYDLVIGFLLFKLMVVVMGFGFGLVVMCCNEVERWLVESEV